MLPAQIRALRLGDRAFVLLLLATFFWGGSAVAGKLANGEVSPMLLTLMRWLIGASLLLPFALKHLKQDWPVIRQNLGFLVFMGAFGFTVFNVLLYTALTHTSAVNVTIEQAAMPLFVFLLNFLVFQTRTSFGQLFGYAITLFGIVLVVSGGEFARLATLDFNIGDVIMMAAAFAYAAYSVGLRAKPQIHWLSFMTTLALVAALFSIPFAIYEATTVEFVWPNTSLAWGIVIYAALFPSIFAQIFYIRGTELLGPNNASLFLNTVPIFGILLSILILGEAFEYYHAIALGLVIGGILLAQKFSQKSS